MVAAGGSGDLLVGLLIGCCLGILVGPAFRAWQTRREWVDASREARLVDHLITGLEAEADPGPILPTGIEAGRRVDTNGHNTRPTWRTSH